MTKMTFQRTYLHLRSRQIDAANHLRHRMLHLLKSIRLVHRRACLSCQAAVQVTRLCWVYANNRKQYCSWTLPDYMEKLAVLFLQGRPPLQPRV